MTIKFDKEQARYIFKTIDTDKLTEAQESLIISFEEQFINKGWLSDRQMEILKDIFRKESVA